MLKYDPTELSNHFAAVHQKDEIRVRVAKPEGSLKTWEMPANNFSVYYIGVDVGCDYEDENLDNSCIQIINRDTGVQSAEWYGKSGASDLGNIVVALGRQYNDAEIAVECNGIGIVTCGHIVHVLKYPNVYRIDREMPGHHGWYTTVKTKSKMMESFRKKIQSEELKINSQELLHEIKGMVETDSRLMAMMIASYCEQDSRKIAA